MRQVQKDHFSLRLRVAGGQIQAEQLAKLSEIAGKYGQGYVHLTSRQGVEIPFVKLADIEKVKQELAEAGLEPGACGPRVRTITACQGSTICTSGMIETTVLAKKLDQKYFARELPHKFKIGVTGCRNNCLKAEENDLGIKGAIKPELNSSACSLCRLCEAVCPAKAISFSQQAGELIFDEQACTHCGLCIKSCPEGAWQGTSGYLVYIGGLFGKRIATGKQLIPILFTEDKLFAVIETTLSFYDRHGSAGERFGNTLDRIGWEQLRKALANILYDR